MGWFRGAVENFRFFDLRIYPFADPNGAVVRAEGRITATGRTDRQEYVLFLRAEGGKIAYLREYFDTVRAAHALDAPIVGGDNGHPAQQPLEPAAYGPIPPPWISHSYSTCPSES